MTLIEDLIETAAVEIAGARRRRLGSHDKTPALSGSVPRCWHSTMLRDDEESFNLNQLWVIQARLLPTGLPLDCGPVRKAARKQFRSLRSNFGSASARLAADVDIYF